MRYEAGDFIFELEPDWAKLPDGWAFRDVAGITVDANDRVYVLNRSEHTVIVLERDGTFLGTWADGLFSRAHGARLAPDGSIFCTDDFAHFVAKFNTDGDLLMVLGEKGKPSDTGYIKAWDLFQGVGSVLHGGPPFNRPTGVAVAPSGDIFVSDGYGNARVHHFNADGDLLHSWGEPGGDPGQFRLPHDIAIDARGRLLVADRENSRIQLFTQEGDLLGIWTNVIRPTGICLDGDGNVYVSELAMRVSIFSGEGELLGRWGNKAADKEAALFHGPHAIGIDSHGDVYVGEVSFTHAGIDKGANAIQKFRRVR